jgi:hypothetical protein
MPRKPTIQPEPLESFTLDDGTVVEIRDHQTREIGRGSEKKWNAEELDWQVLHGLTDDLQSGNQSRVSRAQAALESNHALERYLHDGGYELNERTGRRHGKSIRAKYAQLMKVLEVVKSSAT